LAAREQIVAAWGRIDILINAAGGNIPAATVVGDRSFFDLNEAALDQVFGSI
jgi:NAD(P)-dependent dehydrogenase (short-subunit alcohol dehydrogenase family)